VTELVGRAEELRALGRALDRLAGAVELAGEPGIGKTRLLGELERMADERGHLVLSGSASELERDLPFWVFVDALEDYVRGLPPSVATPAGLPWTATPSLAGERHRTHQAVRELLATLGARQPLVLILDDLHWADPGSLELLGSLLRRPPAARVLLALAVRPRQVPEKLLPALERAHRAGTLTRIELAALTREDARRLHGDAADAVYEESGGNPFYLQQLARALGRTGQVPRDVTAALTEELALLTGDGRRLLQGAAVAGDPFVPDLAAAAADLPDGLVTLDELLQADLVRPTEVPRRFRFRHPLIRRAVYDATPAGWRLLAHERAAATLTGAARAQHVERYAREGDLEAVAALRDAGLAADPSAPATAAHWFGAALRLLPARAADPDRLGLLLLHSRALAQCGGFAAAREALVEALAVAPPEFPLRGRIIAACATTERLLGRHDQARARVERALAALPDRAVPDAVLLMTELAADGFFQTDWERMWEWARKALAVAAELDDPALLAAATALAASADAFAGLIEDARRHCDAAAKRFDALSDEQLAQRLDAGLVLTGAELHLDRFERGRAHGQRTLDVGRATGQGFVLPALLPALGSCYELLGRIDEAVALLEGGIEAARLSENRQGLALALLNRSTVATAAGDVETALATGEEAVGVAERVGTPMSVAFAGFALVRALLAAGRPAPALQLLRDAGGDELQRMPAAWRAGGHELFAHCHIALGQLGAAREAAERCERQAQTLGLGYARAQAARAAAAVALAAGEPQAAAEHSLSAVAGFESLRAPIHAAEARVQAGRALAAGSDRGGAITQFERAAEAFESCGAPRRRDEAERELRRLGRTVYRRSGASGLESLTARELEIARLVVDRLTNAQIAAALFLSKKTVETHLRNIFGKVGVSSRVELARAIERADRGA
jgi:DNA-binding CsgD family transcriptional regulator